MSILVFNHLDGEEKAGYSLLFFSSWCLVIVVCLFLMVPRVCMQFFVIVVFPDHNHLGPTVFFYKSVSL